MVVIFSTIYLAQSESRRSSRRSATEHSRPLSKSNGASTGRSSNAQSIKHSVDNVDADNQDDGDEHISRGIKFYFKVNVGVGF